MYNKKLSLVVMSLLILASIWLGGYRSLNKLYQKVSNIFYFGVSGDGVSINNDLNKRIDSANNLVTVAKRYFDSQDEVIKSTQFAIEDLNGAKDLSDKYLANENLTKATYGLYVSLADKDLSSKDKNYREDEYDNLTSRNATIRNDEYNSFAAEYNNTLSKFPASILSKLVGVPKAELFNQ